ncbi:MAG TPA: glycosyltransferase family A protein [Candidatus Limnocylindrales bacterium]
MSVTGNGPYQLSIVIPTRVGWPHMRRSIDAVLPQLEAARAELIVSDSSGLPVPDFASASNIRWLRLPGMPAHVLRQHGYREARGAIVAITEDHCAPAADWAASILAEHARAPNAAGIFGLVDNGSRDKAVDWALYSVGYLAWAPPTPVARGTPGHANLSFKSWIFRQLPPQGDQVLEFRYVGALRDAGYEVLATDRTLVTHFQSAGLPQTARLLFHNGRMIAGVRRDRMTGRDWLRAMAPGPVALFRTLRTCGIAGSKPQIQANVLKSLPIILMLHLSHTIGEGVGYLGGPGKSGQQVH